MDGGLQADIPIHVRKTLLPIDSMGIKRLTRSL
jgi:hypothetical protein